MIYNLLQKIIELDIKIFKFIQNSLKNAFLDTLMPIVTDLDNWIWLFVLGWILLFILGGKKGRLVSVLVIITILIADNLTSYVLKPFFGRMRPDNTLSFSFPSNHAVNIFALATILIWYYKKYWLAWTFIAGIVGFSRIYLGVHYFLDVLGGMFLGILCAVSLIAISIYLSKLLKKPAVFST